ncbi:MAG: hypothetical protein AAFX03_11815 [Pseudomonadota bacterium]
MALLGWAYPHLRAIDSEGGVHTLTRGLRFGGTVYVVPRGRCQYSRKTMPRTDAKGREAARQQAQFESRFADTNVIVLANTSAETSGDVSIWTWDRAEMEARIGKPNPRMLPETLARKGLDQGFRLVLGVDGYEGEIWQDGGLVATRWWAQQPSPQSWSEFLGGARTQFPKAAVWSHAIDDTPPEPVAPQWRKDVVWVDDNWASALSRVTPPRAAVAAGMVALAPASCEVAKLTSLSLEEARLSAELEAARAASADWLRLRRRALRDARSITDAKALGDDVALVYALLDLDRTLEAEELAISRLSYLDNELQIGLTGRPAASIVDVVSTLEASDSWDDVRFESEGNTLVGTIASGIGAAR